jgi:peptidyl-prolyl cis-trans isomerase D
MEAGQVGTVPGPAPFLMRVIERTPSRIPPLKEIEAKVRDAYVRAMAEAAARTEARKLIGQMKTPADFKRVAETNNLPIHNVDVFDRSTSSIPGLGAFPEVADETGAVATVPGLIGRVMERDGNSYIFQVTSRSDPSPEAWKSARDSFMQEYLSGRRAQAWSRYLEELKSKAKITIDTDQFANNSADSSM